MGKWRTKLYCVTPMVYALLIHTMAPDRSVWYGTTAKVVFCKLAANRNRKTHCSKGASMPLKTDLYFPPHFCVTGVPNNWAEKSFAAHTEFRLKKNEGEGRKSTFSFVIIKFNSRLSVNFCYLFELIGKVLALQRTKETKNRKRWKQ